MDTTLAFHEFDLSSVNRRDLISLIVLAYFCIQWLVLLLTVSYFGPVAWNQDNMG